MAATRAATTASIGIVVAHAAVLAIALALPWLLRALGLDFYLSLASRIVVYAIAATSLNLVLGYAGLSRSAMPRSSASAPTSPRFSSPRASRAASSTSPRPSPSQPLPRS
jgi:hypothetical protein